MEEDFKNMSDENLIAITATSNNNKHLRKAAIELDRRKKATEDKNFKLQKKNIFLQKWILFLTVIILILTAFAVILGIMSYKKSDIQPYIQTMYPNNDSTNPQNKDTYH